LLLRAAVIVAVLLSVLTLAPEKARAASTDCELQGAYSCSVVLEANPRYHAIVARAVTYSDNTVACRVYDNRTWVLVGTVRDRPHGFRTYLTIRGLYGVYQAICVSEGPHGRVGGGGLRNNDYDFY
jgi:hypothetical protein